jgi:hypothetical protein
MSSSSLRARPHLRFSHRGPVAATSVHDVIIRQASQLRREVPNEALDWCAAHHILHWANGGHTALHNLVLLCDYHHRIAHTENWHIRITGGHPQFIPPPWTDPQQQPLRNTTHHPPLTTERVA